MIFLSLASVYFVANVERMHLKILRSIAVFSDFHV